MKGEYVPLSWGSTMGSGKMIINLDEWIATLLAGECHRPQDEASVGQIMGFKAMVGSSCVTVARWVVPPDFWPLTLASSIYRFSAIGADAEA